MSQPDALPEVPGPDAPSEPLITVGVITGLAAAVIDLVIAWGVHLGDSREKGIMGVVMVVAPLLVAFIGRAKVFAPMTVHRMVLRARNQRAGYSDGGVL